MVEEVANNESDPYKKNRMLEDIEGFKKIIKTEGNEGFEWGYSLFYSYVLDYWYILKVRPSAYRFIATVIGMQEKATNQTEQEKLEMRYELVITLRYMDTKE